MKKFVLLLTNDPSHLTDIQQKIIEYLQTVPDVNIEVFDEGNQTFDAQDQISLATVVIADVTHLDEKMNYRLGICMGLDRTVVQIMPQGKKLPDYFLNQSSWPYPKDDDQQDFLDHLNYLIHVEDEVNAAVEKYQATKHEKADKSKQTPEELTTSLNLAFQSALDQLAKYEFIEDDNYAGLDDEFDEELDELDSDSDDELEDDIDEDLDDSFEADEYGLDELFAEEDDDDEEMERLKREAEEEERNKRFLEYYDSGLFF